MGFVAFALMIGVQAGETTTDQAYLTEACGIAEGAAMLDDHRQACLDDITSRLLGENETFLTVERPEIEWPVSINTGGCRSRIIDNFEPTWPVDERGQYIEIRSRVRIDIKYDILSDGSVSNVRTRLTPGDEQALSSQAAFEDAARAAVERWRYPPTCEGASNAAEGVRFRLEFTPDPANTGTLPR